MIDPQTGFDPETGMLGLKETHQPTGAMGAVLSYLNGDKSRQISEALQQHRQAQADMAQQQAQEFAARQQRDDQLRQAMSQLPTNAGPEDVINTGIRNGMDVERVLPWMRAKTAAGGKVDAARVKAGADLYKNLTVNGGQPPNQAIGFLSGVFNADEMDQIKAQIGSGGDTSLPVPAAKAALDTSSANLKDTQAGDITDTAPARQDLLAAKAYALRVGAQAKKEKAATGGGPLKPSTELGVRKAIAAIDAKLEAIASKRDPLTMKLGAADKGVVEELKAQRDALKGMLEGQGDDDLNEVAKPGAAKGSPDPFGSIGFLKQTPKPAGAALTGSGGSSSPPPDNRLGLNLPK